MVEVRVQLGRSIPAPARDQKALPGRTATVGVTLVLGSDPAKDPVRCGNGTTASASRALARMGPDHLSRNGPFVVRPVLAIGASATCGPRGSGADDEGSVLT
jgi:hypothetical protein